VVFWSSISLRRLKIVLLPVHFKIVKQRTAHWADVGCSLNCACCWSRLEHGENASSSINRVLPLY